MTTKNLYLFRQINESGYRWARRAEKWLKSFSVYSVVSCRTFVNHATVTIVTSQ